MDNLRAVAPAAVAPDGRRNASVTIRICVAAGLASRGTIAELAASEPDT